MGIAVWCDVKDKGHAFDEREAIIVNVNGDTRYFCQAPCVPAFVTAFHTARLDGQSGIFLPTLGGHFTVLPSNSQPELGGQQNDGQAQGAAPAEGKPGNDKPAEGTLQAGAPGKGGQARDRHSREAAEAIADLLEQEPRPGARKPSPASYGGRA
jgi:hypothetical protein